MISVHQAFYGIVNQSHSCIHSTFKDQGLNAFLIGFTDRPGPVPPGVKMEPYYSAAAHGNNYVFTLTFPDHNAKRPGMVFTHALIISIEDLKKLNNLDELFSKFIIGIPEIKDKPEILSLSQPSVNRAPKTFQAFIPEAVDKLLSGQSPVIFCGKTDSFRQLIKAIWKGVPSSLRSKITYTIGFSGANVDESKTFVYFQPDLKQQLNNRNFVSDELDQIVEITSIQQKFLLSEDKDNGFNLFMEDLKVDINDWSVIQLTARAFESYQFFSNLNNDALKQLIRQIAKISPRPEDGEIIKGKLITELKKRLVDRSEHNLKSLKNMPLESYQSGERQLQDGVILFIKEEFREENNFNVELISELLLLDQTSGENWWYKGVKKSFEKIKDFTDVTQLKNVWRVLTQSKETLIAMHHYLPKKTNYEELLLNTFPDDIPEKIAKALTEKVRQKKWHLLHARVLQTYLLPKEALLRQFSIEKTDNVENFTGTETILSKTSDTDLLNIALETNNGYFIKKYVDRTVANPLLLNDLKTDNSVWLQIWSGSIEQSKELGLGIINLKEKVEQVLMLLSNGVDLPNKLITAISESPFADLSEHKQRSSIWGQLSADVKNKFLQSTADSLISKPNEGTLDMGTIEYDLKTYIYSDEYLNLVLNKHKADISPVLNFYEKFNLSKDIPLAIYIDNYFQQIDPIKAKRLGRIVNRNRMVKTASSIADKATRGNNNWQFALSECSYLLDFFQRVKLKLSGTSGMFHITDNQWWESLEEWIVEYYPSSSSLITIWKKAGGKESELIMNSTPSEVWNDAISKLRRNQFKEITINDLLMEMNKQYGQNQNFNLIYKIRLDYVKQ